MNINLYLVIAAAVIFLVPTAMAAIDSMHFFQLNSYRFDTHTKWMRENGRKYLSHSIFAVLMLIVLFFEIDAKIKAVALSALLIAAIPAEKPKKAKKPLVYTPRVKRMFFSYSL